MKIEFTIKIPTTTEEATLNIKQLGPDIVVIDLDGLPKNGVDRKVLQAALDKANELYNEYGVPAEPAKPKVEGMPELVGQENSMMFSYGDEK